MTARLVVAGTGAEVAGRLQVARTFVSRSIGLLGRSGLAPDEGLLISPCGSIHTFFMRFRIDICYLDASGAVTKAVPDLGPWRFSFGGPGARSVVELAAGSIARVGIEAGMQLLVEGGGR